MAAADNTQMQAYADQRVRPTAESWREFIAKLRDHKAGIDSVYERAVSASAWNDARTDGPPKKLVNQDMLSFNAFATLLLKLVDSGLSGAEVTEFRASLAPLLTACVRPL